MYRFRVYAFIHGVTLPLGRIDKCEIIPMTVAEQESRGFSPIQYEFSDNEDGYTTYATSLPFVDPMRLQTEHVVICELDEADGKAAIGGAVRAFDRLCSRLFLAGIQDQKLATGHYSGETYLYQVSKIYRLEEGEEKPVELDLRSGFIFLPNRPDRNEWQVESTQEFFDEILKFRDPIFNKSLKYLYSSSAGHFRLDNQEKIALDHFKSIELIVNTLSARENFKDRVDEAAALLDLAPERVNEIKKYWDARSNADLAHSSPEDFTAFYPNQFPLPEGGGYMWAFLDSTARVVILNYFSLRKRCFHVEIERITDTADQESFGTINSQWQCNRLFFRTKVRDKKGVLVALRKAFAKDFSHDESSLQVKYGHSLNTATVLIRDLSKSPLHPENVSPWINRIIF